MTASSAPSAAAGASYPVRNQRRRGHSAGSFPSSRSPSAPGNPSFESKEISRMSRKLTTAVAQLGPIHLADDRRSVVKRLIALLKEAHAAGARFVVFPELALTTFFPRWWMTDQAEIDAFFEREMPGPETRPLFDLARDLGVGFYLGYAELAVEAGQVRRFNTAVLVDPSGKRVGRYRKIHLPGHAEHLPNAPFQHLEKRYFNVGD